MFVRCEVNSNPVRSESTPGGDATSEQTSNGANRSGAPDLIKGVGRNDFLWDSKRNRARLWSLFIAGAVAIIAGLLFPLSSHILDVLLIFSVSLTAAALIITFSARGALEVLGFPLLIVLATMLRMALSVACSKLILIQGDAGTIINLLGGIIVRNNCMFTILTFGALAVVIFGIICKAVKGISRTGTEFTVDIVPIKQIGIDSDLNAGVINNSQALKLREKIARETGFFVAMSGAGRFMLCGAVIELVVIIVNITASMAVGAVTPATPEISVKTYATLAVGAGTMTQISALLVVLASVYLVRKSSVSPAASNGSSEQEFAKRIEVVAEEVNIKTEKKVITEDLQWFDEQSTDNNEKEDLILWSPKDFKDSDYYEAIAELIQSKSADEAKTILMAAESVEELPVTIPINIAMRLAKRGQKCLLIDLDLERDAISKVFDVANTERGDKVWTKAIATGTPTCISNLWLLPAGNFGKGEGGLDATNINDVIASLESRYDRLVVYAPNVGVPLSAVRDRIASCVRAAMLFSGDTSPEGEFKSSAISDFHKLLISYGCEILKPLEVFAEVF